MKKLLSALLCLSLAVVMLAGCSNAKFDGTMPYSTDIKLGMDMPTEKDSTVVCFDDLMMVYYRMDQKTEKLGSVRLSPSSDMSFEKLQYFLTEEYGTPDMQLSNESTWEFSTGTIELNYTVPDSELGLSVEFTQPGFTFGPYTILSTGTKNPFLDITKTPYTETYDDFDDIYFYYDSGWEVKESSSTVSFYFDNDPMIQVSQTRITDANEFDPQSTWEQYINAQTPETNVRDTQFATSTIDGVTALDGTYVGSTQNGNDYKMRMVDFVENDSLYSFIFMCSADKYDQFVQQFEALLFEVYI